eukprot:463638-Pleurochrysis_carterae.AAC.2
MVGGVKTPTCAAAAVAIMRACADGSASPCGGRNVPSPARAKLACLTNNSSQGHIVYAWSASPSQRKWGRGAEAQRVSDRLIVGAGLCDPLAIMRLK